MNESLVVRRETHIAAPPATVFAFLTDPEKILSWMGAEATTEAYPGGLYLIKGVRGDPARVARGAFREVVPVHRLAYTFGWEGGQEVPPTRRSAPLTIGVGPITWTGSPLQLQAAIPA